MRSQYQADMHCKMQTQQRTRSTSLHLGDVLLPQPEVLVDTEHVLPHGQTGHTVRVVRNTTEDLCILSGRERLPPRSAARARVDCKRARTVQWRMREKVKECTYALPSPSGRRFPLKNYRKG